MLSHAERPLRHGRRTQSNIGHPLDHGGKIEATIESVFKLSKVTRYMFFPYCIKGTHQRGFGVAENGVHPFERGVLRGLATTAGHNRHMLAAFRRDSGKAGQAVGEDNRTLQQAGSGIACDLPLLETSDTTQMHFDRPAVVRRLNGGDERGLVMRATAALTGHLTTEVGIVDLGPVAEGILLATLEHHLPQFVLHPPGGVVFGAEIPRELHYRDALLALSEQKDGEEPLGQREFRAVEDRPGGQRGLMMALVYLATVQCVARGVATCRTNEALWPTQPVECLLALLLSAVLFEEGLKTETLLELDCIFGHGSFLRVFRQFHNSGPSGSLAEPLG